MDQRTHLHLVAPVQQVCRMCPALVAGDLAGELCARCLLYVQLDRATEAWPAEDRHALAEVIARVLRTYPPEDVGEFFALVAEVCLARH